MAAKRCKKCGESSAKKEKMCSNCGAKKKGGIFSRLIKYTIVALVAITGLSIYTESQRLANMTPEEKVAYEAVQDEELAQKEAEAVAKAKADKEAKEAAEVIAAEEAAEKAKAEEEERKIAEAEAAEKAKAEEEARLVAEAEAKAEAEEEARILAEAEAEQQRVVDEFKAGQPAYVKTSGTVTGDYTLDVVIETNIPFDFETGVSLSLAGLADDEVSISTSMKKLTVVNGAASTTLDVRDHWRGSKGLPAGDYEIDAKFYPLWQENREVAALLELGEESIGTSTIVTMVGTGESAEAMKAHNKAQRWAMLNINIGDTFGDIHRSNLPDLELISTVKKNGTVDFQYHYSALAEITVIVNSFTGEVVTWREGRVTEG